MGMIIMIRLAKKKDIESITEIYNEAILNTTAVYTYEPVTIENRKHWFECKTEPVFVYEKQGVVVGFATYGAFRDWPAYQNTIEHSIYVDASCRKEGIASHLLEALINEATNKGYKTIVAGIDSLNIGSIKLHEKFGFVQCGHIKKVGYKFNQWLDLSFYQLLLK